MFTSVMYVHMCYAWTLTSTGPAAGYDDIILQDGSSPLHAACFNGNLDLVKTLIETGANVNQATKVHVLIDCMYHLVFL